MANITMCSTQIPMFITLFSWHQPAPKSHCPAIEKMFRANLSRQVTLESELSRQNEYCRGVTRF